MVVSKQKLVMATRLVTRGKGLDGRWCADLVDRGNRK